VRRWFLAIFLVVASSALAGSLYSWLREPTTPERCAMDWLGRKLELTDAQYEKIWSVHVKLCPAICQLGGACATATDPRPHLACERATAQLIAEVCAELTPAQRSKYLELVAACQRNECPSP